jgi:hypothetical protein
MTEREKERERWIGKRERETERERGIEKKSERMREQN